jgi:hypothetical protein
MKNLKYTGTDISRREDDVTYLKSKLGGYDATLLMTSTSLHLESEDSGPFRRGIYQFLPFLKDKLQIVYVVFDMPYTDIASIAQGKQGFNSNVLEVTDKKGQTYRMMVRSYAEWEAAIRTRM